MTQECPGRPKGLALDWQALGGQRHSMIPALLHHCRSSEKSPPYPPQMVYKNCSGFLEHFASLYAPVFWSTCSMKCSGFLERRCSGFLERSALVFWSGILFFLSGQQCSGFLEHHALA